MMGVLKGWKTLALGALVFVGGMLAAFADPAVIAAIPPKWMGIAIAVLGGLFAFLRFVTTTPVGKSGP